MQGTSKSPILGNIQAAGRLFDLFVKHYFMLVQYEVLKEDLGHSVVVTGKSSLKCAKKAIYGHRKKNSGCKATFNTHAM